MERYRSFDANDDPPAQVGDNNFLGVDEYSSPENIRPGEVQQAVNHDFSSQDAQTRGGFVCLPELGKAPFGSKWYGSSRVLPVPYPGKWQGVTFGQNAFVAGGYYNIPGTGDFPCVMRSLDGISWTQYNISASQDKITAISYANGRFVATGQYPTYGSYPYIYYSNDGITWSSATVSGPTSVAYFAGVAYGNGKWVAISSLAFIPAVSSDNGSTWTIGSTLSEFAPARDLTFWNGQFIATTISGQIVSSTNGSSWTLLSTIDDGGSYVIALAFGNDVFCALTPNGTMYKSTDLINWSKTRDGSGLWVYTDIDFYNGRFIVIGKKDVADYNIVYLTSIDGSGWIQYDTGFVGGYFYEIMTASGNNVTVMVSPEITPYPAIYSYTFPTQNVYASGIYSDPDEIGTNWIMLLGGNSLGFYAFGHTSRQVSLGSYNVTEQSTIVQANNYVYIFRGDNAKPLYWNGDWNTTFAPVPDTTLPATYNSIPNSNQATYYQNRLWIRDGKDSVAASDVLAFTDYDPLANEFNLNTGNSDYVVATFPFGQNSLICFKNKSIELMQNVEGSLSDVTVTEITRQVGLVGINAVTSVGPDLAYVSYGNINLLTLTSTNNSLQHKTLPLSIKVKKIIDRVNWSVGYKISLGYWNNKLYVALPLDNSQFCNSVIVYNFINQNWYGEWNFSPGMNMCIQGWAVNDYLGLQRLHAITEDGRILVTDEGQNDISGTTVAEISTELVTRAYDTSNLNHFQRRLYLDMGTCRPNFSCYSYTEGVSEESTVLTDETYSRSQSWRFNDSSYDLTNANNDYNRPYRKDYSTGPDSVQCGTGFLPEAIQEFRMPLVTRREGRLSWLKVTNTQGFVTVMSVGFELRAGQRSNLIQV